MLADLIGTSAGLVLSDASFSSFSLTGWPSFALVVLVLCGPGWLFGIVMSLRVRRWRQSVGCGTLIALPVLLLSVFPELVIADVVAPGLRISGFWTYFGAGILIVLMGFAASGFRAWGERQIRRHDREAHAGER